MQILKKGANVQLTKNFNSREIDCKCKHEDCTITLIDTDFLTKLQFMRDKLDVPFTITSGYRCGKRNSEVGGAALSMHQMIAVDIVCSKKDELEELAFSLGLSVGVHSVLTHIDPRENQIRFYY